MKEIEDEIYTIIHAAKEVARAEMCPDLYTSTTKVEASRKLNRTKQRLLDYISIHYRPRTPLHHHGEE